MTTAAPASAAPSLVDLPGDLPLVRPDSFLTLHYRLSTPAGGRFSTFLTTFGGQPATLSLGGGQLSPALEQCLPGLQEGERKTFDLPAGAAFGERNDDLLQWVGARLLQDLVAGDGPGYVPGDVVQFPTPDGAAGCAATVVQLRQDGAVLFDFNHPLAGRAVRLEVHIIGVL